MQLLCWQLAVAFDAAFVQASLAFDATPPPKQPQATKIHRSFKCFYVPNDRVYFIVVEIYCSKISGVCFMIETPIKKDFLSLPFHEVLYRVQNHLQLNR